MAVFLWVSVQGEGVVKLVDPNTKHDRQFGFRRDRSRAGLPLPPDGSRAYVADFFSNTVAVIDVLGAFADRFCYRRQQPVEFRR